MKTWFVLGSAAAVTAVGAALLAGKDDTSRRFWKMRTCESLRCRRRSSG